MNILNREILKLAIPSILANITVPLVGIADIAVAGHLSGSAAIFIGGISIGSLLFDMLYWNFSFLRIGTGGMTAQAYGRDDMSAAAATLIRSVFVSMLIAILYSYPVGVRGLRFSFRQVLPGREGIGRDVFSYTNLGRSGDIDLNGAEGMVHRDAE